MKRKTLVILVFALLGGASFYLHESTLWPFGRLATLQKQLNAQADATYDTGQDGKIVFTPNDPSEILILSPPYANISNMLKDIVSLDVLEKIQSSINWTETGHLFLIEQGQIADHRLLSGKAEPVFGIARGKEIVLLVSKKETSGRPVRIEIPNPVR